MTAPASDVQSRLGPVERHEITSREQGLALRGPVVGGSEVPSICGCGYQTALAVWARKRGIVSAQADNGMLRRGRWLEPGIWAALREERPDWDLQPAKIWLVSRARRLGCTPDALAIVPDWDGIVVVQGKVVSEPVFKAEWCDGGDEPPTAPLGYQLQTLTEAMLVETAFGKPALAVLAAMVIGTWTARLEVVAVPRHAAAEARILDCVDAFWDDFDGGREPPVNPQGDAETLRQLYPTDDGTTVDLTSSNELPALMDERKALTSEIRDREERKKALETIVRGKMGQHTYALIAGGRRLSLKITHREGYTVQPSSYRQLREVKAK